MDKAFWNSMRWDHFRWDVYNPNWDRIIRRVESLGGVVTNVTRRQLVLGDYDSTTGWYDKNYVEFDAEGLLIPRSSSRLAVGAGTYVRSDYLFLTADPFEEGDEMEDEHDDFYKAESVRHVKLGDSFSHRELDLTHMRFHQAGASKEPSVTVEDARYWTKDFLETHLDNLRSTKVIVAYGDPDYSLKRVFYDRNVDGIYSIGEPTSTRLKSGDQLVYGYDENVPIRTYCVDKKGLSGTKMKWVLDAELRRVTEENPEGSYRLLDEGRPNDRQLGAITLYSTMFTLNYVRPKD